MKELKKLTNKELWDLGYNLAEMMKKIHIYFAAIIKPENIRGRPYNHINDKIEGQTDFMSRYLEIKKILDPLFEEDYIMIKKETIEELRKCIKRCEE